MIQFMHDGVKNVYTIMHKLNHRVVSHSYLQYIYY